MSRTLSRHTRRRALRRLKQEDRDRVVIHARTVDTQDDDLAQRKRIEKLWEQSIDFFIETPKED